MKTKLMKKELRLILSLVYFFSTTYIQSQTLNWSKSFGGNELDAPSSIIVDDIGNIYTIGGFSDTVDFDPNSSSANMTSNGSTDVYIQKLDKDGNFIWIKTLGGTGQDYGLSICKDNSNNIYVVGYFSDTVDFDLGAGIDNITSNGGLDAFLLKLNSDGDVLLKRAFGGIGRDKPNSIAIDSDNTIYVAGEFQQTVDFDSGINTNNISTIGGTDLFVLKLDLNADFIWVKSIGGYGDIPDITAGITGAKEIALDTSGNIYLTGLYSRDTDFDPGVNISKLTSNGQYYIFVLKLDTNGNYLWAKSMGNNFYPSSGRAITVDNFGNVFTTGYFWQTVDFDPGSGVYNLSSNGNFEIYIQKLNTNGDFVWAKSIGSENQDIGTSIITDSTGDIYISGHFSNLVDFDPSNSIINLTSEGSLDIFLLKLDTNGSFKWVKSIGSDSVDESSTVTIDNTGNLYLTGRFSNTMTFDFGNGSNDLTSNGNSDVFTLKFSLNTLSTNNNEMLATISFFPNPTNNKLTIISNENFNISIYDINGRIVKRVTKNTKELSLYLKNLTPGLYLLKGENLKGSFSERIIVN